MELFAGVGILMKKREKTAWKRQGRHLSRVSVGQKEPLFTTGVREAGSQGAKRF